MTPRAASTARRLTSAFVRRLVSFTPVALVAIAFAPATARALPVVYTCGDSTVQTWASGYYPKTGWGQVIPKFFDSTKVTITNKAVGGTSSKSFYDNYWSGVKSLLKSGDYVFVQFGINDSATDTARHTDASTTFKDYLRLYVNETKAKGAYPVLVATLRRNAWNSDGTVYDAYHGYPIATREVAAEMNVPCVDLDGMCKTLMESLGQTYCTYYWYMNLTAGDWPNYSTGQADNVHFQEPGALEMARLVIQGIRSSSYSQMQSLAATVRSTATVTFNRNNSNGTVTRTQAFPQGVTVTAFARPNSGFSFTNWTGSISSSSKISQFTMGTSSMSITGNFSSSGGGGGPIANGTYSLRNVASGKMLDNLGATTDGAEVGQWADGTSNNQKWVVTNVSGSVYKLSCVTGGKYLDSLGHTTDGSTVGQWTSSSSTNQNWTITASGSGYKVINVANGKCLDTAGSTTDGAIMKFYASGSSNNQIWQFVAP